MRAKTFFFVCAGFVAVLWTSLAQAQASTLWTVELIQGPGTQPFSIGTYGAFQASRGPTAVLFGSVPSPGPASEFAIEQHILRPGEMVPLPRYADGTEALESEVFWTVHVWRAKFSWFRSDDYTPAFEAIPGDRIDVGFTGRLYDGGYAIIDPQSSPVQETRDVEAMVTVIAVRGQSPTAASPQSWGSVKAHFRK